MTMEREPNDKGDHVELGLSSRCLPSTDDGDADGAPHCAFKEL